VIRLTGSKRWMGQLKDVTRPYAAPSRKASANIGLSVFLVPRSRSLNCAGRFFKDPLRRAKDIRMPNSLTFDQPILNRRLQRCCRPNAKTSRVDDTVRDIYRAGLRVGLMPL